MPSPSLLFPFKTTNQLGNSFSFDQTKSNQDGATVSPETESVNSGSAEIPVFSTSLVLPVKTRRVSAKKSRKGGKSSSRKTLVLRTQDGTVVEKPKRLRTAYNFFFYYCRQQILEKLPERIDNNKPRNSHGKIDFARLAQTIAAKWKKISPEDLAYFQELSKKDRERYQREMKVWKELENADLMKRSSPGASPLRDMRCKVEEKGENTEPIPFNPELFSLPRLVDFSSALSCDSSDKNKNNMMSLMHDLEPTPLPEHYTPSAVTSSRPTPSLEQLLTPQWDWQSQHTTHMANGVQSGCTNVNKHSMRRLAQSLGSDGVETLIRALRR